MARVLSCTVDESPCAPEHQEWTAQTVVARLDIAWPTYQEMMDAHTVGFMFFFLPALTMALVAYFVREMRDVIG